MPSWAGPAEGAIPRPALPEPLELATTDELALVVTRIDAYPNGFQVTLTILARTAETARGLPRAAMALRIPFEPHEERDPDDYLRFGLRFADGSKVTNLDILHAWHHAPGHQPDRPIMTGGGGSGGPMTFEQTFWCWPLPPSGAVEVACEWPVRGIALTRKSLEADAILEAASRAGRPWPD
jgi:hypothetical protein